jgi:hypothetical protein
MEANMHKMWIGLVIAVLLLSSTIAAADPLCSKLCPGLFGRGGTEETVVKGPGIKTEKGWVEVPYNTTASIPAGTLTYGYTCRLPTGEIEGWSINVLPIRISKGCGSDCCAGEGKWRDIYALRHQKW